MATGESTAGPPPAGSPQRSPQQSIVQARSPQQSIVQARSPKQSVAQGTSSANVPAPSSSTLPPVKMKSSLKGLDSSALVSPPKNRGPLCHNPVTARTPKDMVGAHTERSTGITYPYNMWGPCNPGKYGQEFPAANLAQKYHYEGKHDTLTKDRLEQRDYGHVRHHCYRKNLAEPTGPDSLSWMDPKKKEFWRTDVERVLKQDEEKRRARQKELLSIWTNEEAWRRHHAQKMRDMKYQAYLNLTENMQKVGCRSNKSSAPHINIITREPIGEHNIKMGKFRDAAQEYKRVQRQRNLQERNSGARNYNILNWAKNPPGPDLPPWPEKPPTPPPPPPPDPSKMPLNSSKGALSFARVYGAFGTLDVT
ncbi:hypothetical protein KC19_1G115200 [Ceratodon purpureus]|uniref:Uncharacterized protein n=1 Tax=Ceratodon purpureus TaxID=3225 RepID=A0A8T0J3W9_CERPU|nr:hypothetical protein KC19_1G115200 [Ceratodon purpureus]